MASSCSGARRTGWAIVPVLALVALPKCPLCLAAYLSLLGLGAGVAGELAAAARPSLIALAGLVIGWIALAAWRTVGQKRRPTKRTM